MTFDKLVNNPFGYATRIFNFFILPIPTIFKDGNVRVKVYVIRKVYIVIDLL